MTIRLEGASLVEGGGIVAEDRRRLVKDVRDTPKVLAAPSAGHRRHILCTSPFIPVLEIHRRSTDIKSTEELDE
jgi:hypothetical protein